MTNPQNYGFEPENEGKHGEKYEQNWDHRENMEVSATFDGTLPERLGICLMATWNNDFHV